MPYRHRVLAVASAACWLSIGLLSCPAASAAAEPAPGAEAIASAEELRGWIRELSSDGMQGRSPGTEGDRKARAWVAAELERIGLLPGAEDGWMQRIPMLRIEARAPATWSFRTASGPLALAWWSDYIAFSGVQATAATLAATEVVFVGYGIRAPEWGWDDLGDADLAGKVLLVLNNDPDWDPELFEGVRRLYYGRWDYKYQQAAKEGAAGAIIVHTAPSAGYPWQVVQSTWGGPQFELPADDEKRLEVKAWITEDAARRLLAAAGHDLAALVEAARSPSFRPVRLGITTDLQLVNAVERVESANVLAVLPGSDPERADEFVVYSAHHDNFGIGRADESGDTIYNGALDNAAGVAQLLAIAKALAASPRAPRRSSLFAIVAAEERGLLGSRYFVEHPTVPPGKIVANLNVDGANIWGPTADVTFIGYHKSDLGELVDRHAAKQGRTVEPDQFPEKGSYYRSDQFNFAKIGVPAIYLSTGTAFRGRPEGWGREQIEGWIEKHYHQPSDELTAEWDFAGILEDVELLYRCGLELANGDTFPRWAPGDEFEAARRAALGE